VGSRAALGGGAAQGAQFDVEKFAGQRLDDGVFAAEIEIKRAFAEVRFGGDVVHAGFVKAAAGEDAHRGVQNLVFALGTDVGSGGMVFSLNN